MILHALKEYYDRKAADPDAALAPEGFEWKEIPFIIVIDKKGGLVQIEDSRTQEGKKKRAKSFLVPSAEKRTVGVKANLLWDNAEYALGAVIKGKPARVKEQHQAFIQRLDEVPNSVTGKSALRGFVSSPPFSALEKETCWEEIIESNPFITFRLRGEDDLICQHPDVIKALTANSPATQASLGVCLVTGDTAEIERLHPPIKGVWGAQSSGGNIISFNARSFESYGKTDRQGANAPVGKSAAFAYTTALNHLLSKDSNQRIQAGDASAVFWAGKRDDWESMTPSLFAEPPKDDPDRGIRAVEALFKTVEKGVYATDSDDTMFYVLGLAPNAARISVRFWQVGTVAEMGGRFRKYFEEMDIINEEGKSRYLPLISRREKKETNALLNSLAFEGDPGRIPPKIAGDIMRAILTGGPYPATMLQAAIRRIRADRDVRYPRAALIKAYTNRNSGKEELKMALDKDNPDTAYRLGRLFAVLEKTQEEASPGINATIRDRYYGSASGAPVTVFPTLLKLKNHHIAKLENRGRAVNLEKLIGEIVGGVDEFPAQLTLQDQGKFAIGYYHQRQDFFKKND